MNDYSLSATKLEQARRQAIEIMRVRLAEKKPNPQHYASANDAARIITRILIWSKVFVSLVALLAVLASAVRTVQTASEIYTASGSHPIGVLIAALAFTLAAEFALFVLALAQEHKRMKMKAEKRPRRVASLATLWHGVLVRIGARQPLPYDQLDRDNTGLVIFIAFMFTIASNAFQGMRPLLAQIGNVSLQQFVIDIVNADARLQLTFLVDMAAVFFPPFMALAAGHLTARFAAEVAESQSEATAAFERDLASWRAAYNEPLVTAEGQEVLDECIKSKLEAAQARAVKPASKAPVKTAKQGERTSAKERLARYFNDPANDGDFDGLLTGVLTPRQIAEKAGISHETIRQYVRAFKVKENGHNAA